MMEASLKELLASGGDISDVGGWCRFPRHLDGTKLESNRTRLTGGA